jgi:hypothetical protein
MSKHEQRTALNYFARYRPQGDSLKAKVARAQMDSAQRRITLPRLRWLEQPPLPEEETKGGRS